MRNKGHSEHQHGTFRRELLYILSFCGAVLRHGGNILRRLLARTGPRCVSAAPVAVCTITVVLLLTRGARCYYCRHGEGIRRLALGPERPQVVLPRVQHDDRFPLSHTIIDLVRIDGHAAHRERRAPRVGRELRDGDEGAGACVHRRLHDCAKGKWDSELGMCREENLAHHRVP